MRRISYSGQIGACLRRLGLRRVMQWAYANLRGNPDRIRLSVDAAEATFSTRSPQELRCVEGAWFSEREMLSGILSRICPEDVFLDVGSNLGLFAIFAAKVVGPRGTVLAFEPEAVAYSRLTENVRLNGLGNVKVFKMALSDGRTTCKLILGDPEAVGQSAHLGEDAGPSESVESAEYDWLVSSQSLPIPRIVKMDIEGHEFAALRGMRATLSNPACSALFCEIHPPVLPSGVSAENVLELIRSYGFDSVRTSKRSTEIQVVATK
jgi:FkbM family methyltransferase